MGSFLIRVYAVRIKSYNSGKMLCCSQNFIKKLSCWWGTGDVWFWCAGKAYDGHVPQFSSSHSFVLCRTSSWKLLSCLRIWLERMSMPKTGWSWIWLRAGKPRAFGWILLTFEQNGLNCVDPPIWIPFHKHRKCLFSSLLWHTFIVRLQYMIHLT